MTPEKQAIQQIAERLQHDNRRKDPVLEDIAEQYAALCTGINQRLLKCRDFLDKGMRSEAVHEAGVAPALIEIVEAANFKDLQKWRKLCEDLDLPRCQPLLLEIVERLRGELAKEEALAPLLKQYRRLVYQGDRDGSIRLLRDIRVQDPANRVWAGNLTPLEEEQLPELAGKVSQALKENNLPRLRELHGELTHPQRAVPPPPELMKKIEAALNAEHVQGLQADAERLSGRLQAAFQAQNAEDVGALLAEWDRLAGTEGVQPSAEITDAVQATRAWLEGEQARIRQEDEHRQAITAMWDYLGGGEVEAIELEKRWHELTSGGRPAPEELRHKVLETRAALEQQAAARRHTLWAAVCVVLVLLLGAVLATAWHVSRTKGRQATLDRLQALAAAQRYAEVKAEVDRLATADPSLCRNQKVGELRTKAETALEADAQRVAKLKSLMDGLERVRSGGYKAPDEAVRHLLEEAGPLAVGHEEDVKALKAWEVGWNMARARDLQTASQELAHYTEAIRRGLQERTTRPFASLDAEQRALLELDARRREGEAVLGRATPAAVEEFNAAVKELDAWAAQFATAKKAATDAKQLKEQALQRLRSVLPDLAAYEEALKQLVEAQPQAPDTAGLRRVLQQMPQIRQAVALHDLAVREFPPGPDVLARLQELVGPEGALCGSVWEADINACLGYAKAAAELQAKLTALAVENKAMTNSLLIYYRPKGEEAWRPLYHPKPLRSREEKDDDGAYTAYWGEVYYFSRDDEEPYLSHTSKLFPNKLNTREYEVRAKRVDQENVAPLGQYLMRFLADSVEAKQIDVYTLNAIAKLRDERDLPLVPKGWLARRLVSLVAEQFPSEMPEMVAVKAAFERINTDVPWMNPRHPRVLAAEEEIHEALGKLPDVQPIIARLSVSRGLLARALSRGVRVAGSFWPGAGGLLELVPAPGTTVGVAWILPIGDVGLRPQFKVAVQAGPTGRMGVLESVQSELVTGQIALAPADDATGATVLKAISGATRSDDTPWPTSWPVNDR